MNPNKALWEKGDFTKIAEAMRESGAALVDKLDVKPGMKVLDLGCGDGTTAIPEAKLGAEVTGVDIAENLVLAGKLRASHENLANLTFQEGDATDLKDLPDESFDLVVSIFGAMFAPRPMEVAKEMVRVTKPGGRIVMGNWIPGDPSFASQLLKISSAYAPPPPEGFVSPMLWGVEEEVIARFTHAGIARENISLVREPFTFTADFPTAEFVDRFRNYYGPTMNAFDAAEQNGKSDALRQELEALFAGLNDGGPEKTSITAYFLKVTVQK